MSCFSSARYNCTAVILRPVGSSDTVGGGQNQYVQDPISGAIVRKWTNDSNSSEVGVQKITFDCSAEGFADAGIRVLGTNEKVDDLFRLTDMVKIFFSPSVHITGRDKITEIREKRSGKLVWREEESEYISGGQWVEKPTVFDVRGVTPVINPMVGNNENYAILERSEVQ